MTLPARVLIVGANGLLGQNLIRYSPYDVRVLAVARGNKKFNTPVDTYINFFLEDKGEWNKVIKYYQPDCIINTAALTNVDLCEVEKEQAYFLNFEIVRWMVDTGLPVIHFSTDYVFDGKNGPYSEIDMRHPLGIYGKTKEKSEVYCLKSPTAHSNNLVLRTMTLWGHGEGLRSSFVDFIKSRLIQEKEVMVVIDQLGNPTLVDDLALVVWELLRKQKSGLFHVAGTDRISRYDWAVEIAKQNSLDPQLIQPCITSDLEQLALRPLNSGFTLEKLQTTLGWLPRGLKKQLEVI